MRPCVQGRIVDRGIRKSIPQRIIAYSIDCITKFVYNFTITEGGAFMPTIKSSADLRNNYNEISTYCHNYPEPVFITKNGKGDLAVMSIEAYEELTSRLRKGWMILPLAIPDRFKKPWLTFGAAAGDELSGTHHQNCGA